MERELVAISVLSMHERRQQLFKIPMQETYFGTRSEMTSK
jgi:hypothetical protein